MCSCNWNCNVHLTYSQAVLEATWPSDMTNSSQLMWNKLRNVIVGAALFKKAGKKSARRRLSSNVDFLIADKTDGMEHALSRSSLDSSHSQDTEAAHSDCESSFDMAAKSQHSQK